MRYRISCFAIALLALACGVARGQSAAAKSLDASAGAQSEKRVSSDTAAAPANGDAAKGKKLFTADGCYGCHDYQGVGAATGPRIGPPPLSLPSFLRYVRAPSGNMPPYTAKIISDQDLADIYAYLKSLAPPAAASGIPLLKP